MRQRLIHYLLLAALLIFFLWALNARYPLIGEDYFYAFPRLLEGKWHFLRQGFWPLRFAPHLCGGMPQYGNPQDHFYSLPQLFSLFADAWTATLLSVAIIVVTGYAGWVRFGRDVLRLSSHWSHTLALVCLSSGFYLLHLAVGHLWVISLPLLSWLLWLTFFPVRETIGTLIIRAIAFASISAYIVYSGSQTVAFLIMLVILCLLPLDLLLAADLRARVLTLLRRLATFGICSLILLASKLVAVYSLMRTAEIKATFSGFHADDSVWFALKSFWALPQSPELFVSSAAFVRIQEESMYTPHVALLGLIALAFLWYRRPCPSVVKKWASVLYVAVLTVFIFLLVRGIGTVPEFLQHFPLFSALRVPERFLYILSLLIVIAGVYGASEVHATIAKRWNELMVTGVIGAMTVLLFAVSYVSLLSDGPLNISLPYDQILASEQASDFLLQPVTQVFVPINERVSDFYYIYSGSTGTDCYEAFDLHLPPLRSGPVDLVYDGAFNIYNPVCLQYPEVNDCSPRDRISVNDQENFERFTHGEPTTWKLSGLQVFADWMTLLGLLLLVPVLGYILFSGRRERMKEHSASAS